ncbi:hypothetical protein RclHR1_12910004 [Rhizophagus clarus]|uniref:Reverse transcriptase domain-containing protein n=1 Tax=Rhizophagus clarus TaxID=94130 RepID=A0A2Z6QNG3_9GLOM|nr:hypothetical protein RclHR1_12910004 [Rhizophagus clarus]
MLKHLNIINQSILHAFICVCIDLGIIPDAWKKATVYLIPKPKPFFVSLTNTRPITLLETPRKAFISLLNKRLNAMIKQYNVLRGHQFVALPGNSTFEPLRIINKILQDANKSNNELWLLSQDLGKAYDRVNIFMLEKAMNPYEVIIGIDQGEVILPLLWCIYYDPLLCEVESRKLGYTISAPSISLNNNPCDDSNQVEEDSLTISSIAFIDDTQWLAPDKSNLESILKIADSFYRLTDIQVNKEKSSLLLRKKRFDKSKLRPHNPIQLDFGFDTITITPTSPFESTRILGVYFDE